MFSHPIFIAFIFCSTASATVLASVSQESDFSSRSSTSSSTFSTAAEMRSKHRVAVGASAGGRHGLFGVDVELDFTPDFAVLLGYGGGPGYQALSLHSRRYLGGHWLSPYVGLGWSQWRSEGGDSFESSSPEFLSTEFLNGNERSSGKFKKNLLIPSIGLQFLQLKGETQGLAIFAEFTYFVEVEDISGQSYGSLGLQYYF